MRRAPLLAVLITLFSLAACAGAPAQPGGAGPAASGGGDPAALYRARCSGCHRPYEPSSRTRARWRVDLARMAPRAHLSPAETEALRGFLEAGASDAPR